MKHQFRPKISLLEKLDGGFLKLQLESLTILNDRKALQLNNLKDETRLFFEKIPGYDTLRLILCKKAILVEGDSDELVVQKAYMKNNNGKLPIEDCIDVISVGTSFLRFLEIAEKINKLVVVVTDNDGNIDALMKKYQKYLNADPLTDNFIKICFDSTIDKGDLKIGNKQFNYNTLEPKIVKLNGLSEMNTILGKDFTSTDELHKYMYDNKTECALKVFDTIKDIKFPQYILEAIK